MNTHIEHAIYGGVLTEGGGVDEEARDEEDGIGARQLILELRLPSLYRVALTEGAGIAGESRCEDLALILKLRRVVGILSDVITECSSVSCGRARENTTKTSIKVENRYTV